MESQKGLTEEQWETELVERIAQVDRDDSGIDRMTKKDYIIVAVIVTVCLCVVVAGAFISVKTGNLSIKSDLEKEVQVEENATGSWKKGTLYYKDYAVILSCPEVGHPSYETDWSTSYMDETKNIDVAVDFRFQDEQLDEKAKALKEEGRELLETNLWEHEMVYYIADHEYEAGKSETKAAKQIIAMFPIEDGTYIQIEITGVGKELPDAKALLADERFQEAFMIDISKKE